MEPQHQHEQHALPGPSLWPVGFAVGIATALIGLVISWVVAGIGAAVAIVFGFLWVRELATGRDLAKDTTPVPDEGAPERPLGPALPAPSGGPAMPHYGGAERFPRSKFLEGATLGLGGVIGGIVTVPVVGFAVLPPFLHQGHPDIDLGPLSNFPEGKFMVATFMEDPSQGEVSRRTAFVRNNGVKDGLPSFTVISNRCAHLGCPVQPGGPILDDQRKTVKEGKTEVTLIPTTPAGGFICPCHGGSYDTEGNRTAGPPVRALDRWTFAVKRGNLVLLRNYSVGHVEGTGANARIRKYDLHGPGQHVDGPEFWFYPVQAPH
ncbi:MAG TPA: Rieske (2Fe-2S) protein [Gaiellaceae bacterium]|nr:Rieske (2Fe-2S) protein [Gaiellaceae bacterium]